MDPRFPWIIDPIPPVPSGIRWDPRSNLENFRPRSTVELHHGIRLNHGSNTALSREIFWDHRSDFGIHGHVWTLLHTGGCMCIAPSDRSTFSLVMDTDRAAIVGYPVHMVRWSKHANLAKMFPRTVQLRDSVNRSAGLKFPDAFWNLGFHNYRLMMECFSQVQERMEDGHRENSESHAHSLNILVAT